jgi:hypothetical protein
MGCDFLLKTTRKISFVLQTVVVGHINGIDSKLVELNSGQRGAAKDSKILTRAKHCNTHIQESYGKQIGR